MNKKINLIRDIKIIESELDNAIAGFLSVNLNEDIIPQYPTAFVYLDKNIHIFFNGDAELFNKISHGTEAAFTIIRSERAEKVNKENAVQYYSFVSIRVEGYISKADDSKLINELNTAYKNKYARSATDINFSKILIIDTNEIHAVEEVGV